jgi:hypothetical protein
VGTFLIYVYGKLGDDAKVYTYKQEYQELPQQTPSLITQSDKFWFCQHRFNIDCKDFINAPNNATRQTLLITDTLQKDMVGHLVKLGADVQQEDCLEDSRLMPLM